jgi:hypothetical protein
VTSLSPFVYRAFGLCLVANMPVPGLTESEGLCLDPGGLHEVRLSLDSQPDDFRIDSYASLWYESDDKTPEGVPCLSIYSTADENPAYWLRYHEGTNVFFGENLTRIWVNWPKTSCLEDAATYLLGPVMAIFAQLRGATCLHGCAVVIDGGMIGLLGPQGAGKSTTAAAFARAGYPVAADDLILLEEHSGRFIVEPASPVLRLWPSSVELLFGHMDALPKLTPEWPKRALNLAQGEYFYQKEALPLAALYFLRPRSDSPATPSLKPVSGSAALMQLVSNSWAHYVNKPAFLASQLRVLTRLSRCVPIREATAHADFGRISQFCRILVEDVHGVQAGLRTWSSERRPAGESFVSAK